MPETAKMLDPGFSVADAQYPRFALSDGTLNLEFVDWQDSMVRVRFVNTAGVKWQELIRGDPRIATTRSTSSDTDP